MLYVCFHILTMSGLNNPESFNATMKTFQRGPFFVLEWLLAVPVIFHAVNGGRLLLYELFENRQNRILIRWVLGLSFLYCGLLAVTMATGGQTVSAPFFWGYTGAAALCVSLITIQKLVQSPASFSWKLQRVTGAFLFLMVPAHMVFMHLNPAIGHDAQVITTRMNIFLIKLVDFSLMAGILFHGTYGLFSICRDYIVGSFVKAAVMALIALLNMIFFWIGLTLIISV